MNSVVFSNIVFENIGETLVIDPSKTYVFFYQGAYSPMHKGHVELIFDTAIRYNQHNNIYILIHQVKRNRHGVDKTLKQSIVTQYLNWCPWPSHKLAYVYDQTFEEICRHPFVRHSDYMVICRGYEHERTDKLTIEHERMQYRMKLRTKNKPTIYLITQRQKSVISATEWIKKIKSFQKNRSNQNDHHLLDFFPAFLPLDRKKQILRQLLECRTLFI